MATLYDVLEVPRDATVETIRSQYKRLALRYHPDKNQNDPSAADRFKRVQHAYEVLRDPAKRSAYDRFGDRGVEALEHGVAAPFVSVVGSAWVVVWALGLAFAFSAAFLMTLAGVAAKLDGANDWSWAHSLFGVWVADALIGIFAALHLVGIASALMQREFRSALLMLVITVALGATIAWTVLVSTQLDDNEKNDLNASTGSSLRPAPNATNPTGRTWVATNAPGFFVLGLILVSAGSVLRQALEAEAAVFAMNGLTTALLLLVRVATIATPLVQLVLVSLKADAMRDVATPSSMRDTSWFAVLAPSLAFPVMRLVSSAAGAFVMVMRGEKEWRSLLCFEVCGWAAINSLYLTTVGMIAAKLQFPDATTRSWGATLAPWFVASGLATLLLCFASCATASSADDIDANDSTADNLASDAAPTPAGFQDGNSPRHAPADDGARRGAARANDDAEQVIVIVPGGPPYSGGEAT
jgi:hypothetical protein